MNKFYKKANTPEEKDGVIIHFNIDPSLSDLVQFTEENEYDFELYERRAASFSKAFKNYYNKLKLSQSKEFVLDAFLEEVHLVADFCVTKRGYYEEKNIQDKYRKLKELILINPDWVLETPKVTGQDNLGSNPTSFVFFENVRNGIYGEVDTIRELKAITDNYDHELLRCILQDLDLYLSLEKEEIESKITGEEIDIAIESFNEKGLEIPYKKPEGNGKLGIEIKPSIDLENLLYPFEFFSLKLLGNKIANILEDNVKSSHLNPTQNDNNPEIDEEKETTAIEVAPEKHPHIFIEHGFILFERLASSFDLTCENGTILRFIWEKMKDDYIRDTINMTQFTKWVNRLKMDIEKDENWHKEIVISGRNVHKIKNDIQKNKTFNTVKGLYIKALRPTIHDVR